VPQHVRQGLLHDAIGRDVNGRGQWLVAHVHLQVELETGRLQGRGEIGEAGERGGRLDRCLTVLLTEETQDAAQVGERLGADPADVEERLPRRGRVGVHQV
jgi:hypothetical protein